MDRFDEKIIGYESTKNILRQILDTLKRPEIYKSKGASIPRGLLMESDPGLGKSLLATVFIKESGRKSYVFRKTSQENSFLDELRAAFLAAKEAAPSILLLEDLNLYVESNSPYAPEWACLQACIDDAKSTDLFVIATTNDTKYMPPSLLRPGRFDYTLYLDPPMGKIAEKIVSYYLRDKDLAEDVLISDIVKAMPKVSCATVKGDEAAGTLIKSSFEFAVHGLYHEAMEQSRAGNNSAEQHRIYLQSLEDLKKRYDYPNLPELDPSAINEIQELENASDLRVAAEVQQQQYFVRAMRELRQFYRNESLSSKERITAILDFAERRHIPVTNGIASSSSTPTIANAVTMALAVEELNSRYTAKIKEQIHAPSSEIYQIRDAIQQLFTQRGIVDSQKPFEIIASFKTSGSDVYNAILADCADLLNIPTQIARYLDNYADPHKDDNDLRKKIASAIVNQCLNYTFYGNIKDGKADGIGLVYRDHKLVFGGEFKKGKPCGYGIVFGSDIPNVDYAYESGDCSTITMLVVHHRFVASGDGYIYYGFKTCRDTQTTGLELDDNAYIVYDGDLKENQKDGQGKRYFYGFDGKPIFLLYEGSYKDDECSGKGKSYYSNGQICYEGEYKKGKYNGKGTLYNEDGSVQYKGNFKDGNAA